MQKPFELELLEAMVYDSTHPMDPSGLCRVCDAKALALFALLNLPVTETVGGPPHRLGDRPSAEGATAFIVVDTEESDA